MRPTSRIRQQHRISLITKFRFADLRWAFSAPVKSQSHQWANQCADSLFFVDLQSCSQWLAPHYFFCIISISQVTYLNWVMLKRIVKKNTPPIHILYDCIRLYITKEARVTCQCIFFPHTNHFTSQNTTLASAFIFFYIHEDQEALIVTQSSSLIPKVNSAFMSVMSGTVSEWKTEFVLLRLLPWLRPVYTLPSAKVYSGQCSIDTMPFQK